SPSLAPIRARARAGDAATAAALLLESFRAAAPARFFESVANDREAPTRLGANEVLARASALCRGRFDLLGYRDLSFGDPVDWHLDPVSGRRAPLEHWTRLDPLDANQVGDHKVIWELNRHQWLVCLGQAYRWSHDERYAKALVASIRGWMTSNPPRCGINSAP